MQPLFELSSGQQVYLPSDPRSEWLERDHYSSRTQINARDLKWDHNSSHPESLLNSGQETISGRPEQKYLPPDQRLEWPACGGPLFKPVSFRKFHIAYPDR